MVCFFVRDAKTSTDQLQYLKNFFLPSSPYNEISKANPRVSICSKEVIRNNTEKSVELVCPITHSLILFCLFKFKETADQLFYSHKFYFYQNMWCILFALKKAHNVKVICKVMGSLVKQNVFVDLWLSKMFDCSTMLSFDYKEELCF